MSPSVAVNSAYDQLQTLEPSFVLLRGLRRKIVSLVNPPLPWASLLSQDLSHVHPSPFHVSQRPHFVSSGRSTLRFRADLPFVSKIKVLPCI